MIIVTNSFSINMLSNYDDVGLYFKKVSDDIKEIKKTINSLIEKGNYKSYIGHEDLAKMFNLEANRANYQFNSSDIIYILQYTGPRLPEGTTKLPEGAKITLWQAVYYK